MADNPKQLNSITFRITRSTGSWIGLGLCHKNIVVANGYDFIFDTTGHGCYMISANGGTWSHIDADSNNIVRVNILINLDIQNRIGGFGNNFFGSEKQKNKL